jgi:hypothetical protein
MEQANSPADEMAKIVFWIVMFAAVGFIAAVLILIR